MKTWDDIYGWFDFKAVYVDAVQTASNGSVFVEVGCYTGRSVCCLGDLVRRSGKTITIFGVEHGLTRPGAESCIPELIYNVSECGLSDYVNILATKSVEAAKLFEDNSLDFIFIDADHSYRGLTVDLRAWNPKRKFGKGVMAGHDYGPYDHDPGHLWPEVRLAVNEFFGIPHYDKSALKHPLCDSCWLAPIKPWSMKGK